MSIHNDFHAALADTYTNTLRQLLEQDPSTTVHAIRELVAEYPSLGDLTLTQLIGGRGKQTAAPTKKAPKAAASKPGPKKRGPAKAASAPAGSSGGWDVRTEAGRAKLQSAVLEGLRECGGHNVPAADLRSLGATPQQLRTTLNRLIEDGVVTFTGRARGTRYSLV